ncbi:hypothetical protein HFD88_005774 [Aspergillus terreus]|nr:hypothetical protein HFD88_005774 [Aspergillus terreus]
MAPRRYTKEWAIEKIRTYLSKKACCPAAKEMDTKFLEEICKKHERLAVTQMDPDQICTTFGLTRLPQGGNFVPPLEDCFEIPSDLASHLRWVSEALGKHPANESESRLRVDAIIIHCLRAERAWMNELDTKPANELNLTLETTLSVLMRQSDTPLIATGRVDYVLWYNMRELESSLFVLEAKSHDPLSEAAKFQCLGYMSMIQAVRKANGRKNLILYGLVTNGFYFVFLCLDNDHQWSEWISNRTWDLHNPETASQIYTLMRLIIRNSASLSPRCSPAKKARAVKQTLLLTDPVAYHIRHRSSSAEDAKMDTDSDWDCDVAL